MNPRALALVLVLAAATALAGCEPSKTDITGNPTSVPAPPASTTPPTTTRTAPARPAPRRSRRTTEFRSRPFPVAFRYPREFTLSTPPPPPAGAQRYATRLLTLDAANAMSLQRVPLGKVADEQVIAAAERNIRRVFAPLAVKPAVVSRTTAAGLPALDVVVFLRRPRGARVRSLVIFDGRMQYTLNCQGSGRVRGRLFGACALAMRTIRRVP